MFGQARAKVRAFVGDDLGYGIIPESPGYGIGIGKLLGILAERFAELRLGPPKHHAAHAHAASHMFVSRMRSVFWACYFPSPADTGELDHSSPLLSFLDEELVEFGGSAPGTDPPNSPRSVLDLEILRRRFALVRHLVVVDNLPLVQAAEAGLLDGRDMHKYVLSAASLRLNKSVPLLRIEPLHGAACHSISPL
jgi:hypothetical protein